MGRPQVNAVYILWLRAIKRYFRNKSRIIGSLGQPVLFLVALGFGFGPIYAKAGGGNYIDFLAPGVIAMSILFTGIFSGIEIIWDRQFGFLKETLVAPVGRFNIMLGRTLGGATVAMLQGIFVLILSVIIGFRPEVSTIPLTLIFMFLISILFTSLGTAIGCTLTDMQGFQLIMNFLVQPIFFLSGALFPLTNLPGAISIITRIDPLTYGVDGLRGALGGITHFGVSVDLLVLSVLSAIILGIGSYLFNKVQI